MFLGSSIYGHFRRRFLTLNESLELELDAAAKRIKSKKTNGLQTVLSAPSPFSRTQRGPSACLQQQMLLFSHPLARHMVSINGQLNLQPILNHLWCQGDRNNVGSQSPKSTQGLISQKFQSSLPSNTTSNFRVQLAWSWGTWGWEEVRSYARAGQNCEVRWGYLHSPPLHSVMRWF